MAIAKKTPDYQKIFDTYDPEQSILWTIPGVGDQPGNTINVNTLSEPAVDELIAKYGGQGPLIGRKNFLQAERMLNQTAAPTTEEQIQAEAMKRSGAELQKRLDAIFGQQEQLGTEAIDRSFAPQRSRVASELAASGNLTSPISRYGLDELDRQKSLAMGQLFGNLGSQRASGQMDTAKTIESILQGERRAKESGDQFSQSLQFGRDKLQSDILQANEDRGLKRYLFDAQQRQERDLAAPDEWSKQLGRINGVFDTYNKGRDAIGNGAKDVATILKLFGA